MSFRIRKVILNTGLNQNIESWVVEEEKEKRFLIFFKKKYWTHFIGVSGIESKPWYFVNKEIAMHQLIFKIENQTIVNSR